MLELSPDRWQGAKVRLSRPRALSKAKLWNKDPANM